MLWQECVLQDSAELSLFQEDHSCLSGWVLGSTSVCKGEQERSEVTVMVRGMQAPCSIRHSEIL